MRTSIALRPYTPRVADIIDTQEPRRPTNPLVLGAVAVMVVAVGLVLFNHRDPARSASTTPAGTSNRGVLTAAEYATAVHVARPWTAQHGAHVSTAFATLGSAHPNNLTVCPPQRPLVVTLVGKFPHLVPGGDHEDAAPPGTVIIVEANPDTGQTCGWSVGHESVNAPPGSANLKPAL